MKLPPPYAPFLTAATALLATTPFARAASGNTGGTNSFLSPGCTVGANLHLIGGSSITRGAAAVFDTVSFSVGPARRPTVSLAHEYGS